MGYSFLWILTEAELERHISTMLRLCLALALCGLALADSMHKEHPEEHIDPNDPFHHAHDPHPDLHVDDHFIVHDQPEEPANKQVVYPGQQVGVYNNMCAQYYWPAGTYPYPSDCRKYVNCANGVTNVMNCPANTVFNPTIKVCDHPQNVPYCNYNAPVGTPSIYANNICQQNGYGNGVYFHPYDCSQYINCNLGQTSINVCPAGTIYNNIQRQCLAYGNAPYNGNPYCSQFVFQPQVVNPGVVVQPNYQNWCGQGGYTNGVHPDPSNCYGYIQCNYGQTTHMACPAGLSFDANLLVCDDQRYNNCNGRPLVGR